jgi:hypothetical protein
LTALSNATINFQAEVLLLIRATAGSGSIKISLLDPTIVDKDIVFRVVWQMPSSATNDMNYQCFAVTLPKTMATNARIVTELKTTPGMQPVTLNVKPQIIPLGHSESGF